MTNDTLTRARAVLATIHAMREAGYLAAPDAWDEALAPSIELDAVPVLIRLAEAVGRRAEAEVAVRWAEQSLAPLDYDDPRIDDAIRRRDLAVVRAALIVPEADEAIDAALAELAVLDGGGEDGADDRFIAGSADYHAATARRLRGEVADA